MRRRRILGSSVAAAALAVTIALAGTGSTDASWTTAETGSGTVTAGTVNPPRLLSCSQPAFSPPTFSWGAPTAGGLAFTGYHWRLLSGATVAREGTVATASVTITSPGILATGSYTFSATTIGPGTWESVPGPTGTYNVLIGLLSSCSVP